MKVLFCTDGSKTSLSALKNFSKWAKAETIVDTICVIDWSFLPDDVLIEAQNFPIKCANLANGILNFAKNEIQNSGILFGETIKQCGSAIESILEQSQRGKYDLILLGSHGKKGLQKWLGSVSREIAYSKNTSSYITKRENNGEKILFATDGTESANFAITKAIEELNFDNKKIYLCTVNETPDMLFLDGTLDTNWVISIEKQQQKFSLNTLKQLEKRFRLKGLEIYKSSILSGNPSKKIIDFAKEEKIDLIILGDKGKNKMQNFLLGSVSKRVLENSKSDVIIYKS